MKKAALFFLCLALFLSACGKGEAPPEGAVARVGSEYIYAETLEADRLLGITGSDREIVEGKVLNMLMLSEANAMGLAATEEEIAEFMASQEKAWQTAGVRERIEAMYGPLDIDFDEYKAMVAALAPGTAARQKLRDHYGLEYCQKQGIEFAKVNPPAEMTGYINEQLQKLWDKYKGEYEIYID